MQQTLEASAAATTTKTTRSTRTRTRTEQGLVVLLSCLLRCFFSSACVCICSFCVWVESLKVQGPRFEGLTHFFCHPVTVPKRLPFCHSFALDFCAFALRPALCVYYIIYIYIYLYIIYIYIYIYNIICIELYRYQVI